MQPPTASASTGYAASLPETGLKALSRQATGTEPGLTSAAPTTPTYNIWKDPILWALLVVAFAVRVLYNLALHPDGHPPLDFVIDEREYFSAAHVFAEGRGFSFYNDFIWVRPPLYVLFLGLLFQLGGVSYQYLPVLLAQSLLSVASLIPFGLLARDIGGQLAARWTLLLGALYLPFTLFAGLLVSETLFLVFFGFALLALWRSRQAFVAGNIRRGYLVLGLSGVLLGCATLTRSTALVFIFVAALWLLLSLPRTWSLKSCLVPAAVLVVIGLATLLPWTARNYAAYGRLIPLDTTAGYNLWLASMGVRDEPRMVAELVQITNQGERQDYAFARASERIAEDPFAFAGKGLKESLDLWKPLLSAEENAVRGYPSGRVPAWHLLALLVFDNLLYVAILVLAVLGLSLSQPSSLKWLTGSWVLLWVLTSFVFFAVTRFRLPVVAALLPWAGVGIAALPRLSQWRHTSLASRIASVGTIAAVLLLVVLNIPVADTFLGVDAWQRQAPYREGERLLGEGRVEEAVQSYRRADTNIGDTRYGLAAALLQQGKIEEAMSVLRPNEPEDRYEVPILRGQAARMQGNLDNARSSFNARVVQVGADAALRWAWDHLRPETVQTLELGSGLDVGYVQGFYTPEKDPTGQSFRWSTGEAMVRGLGGGPCSFQWSGWRPSALPHALVQLGSDSAPLAGETVELPNSPEWVVTEPKLSQPDTINSLELKVNSFVYSGSDPRLLGVQIARVDGCRR